LKKKKDRKQNRQRTSVRRLGRLRLLALGIFLLFLLMGGRLFQLQILEGKAFSQLARKQQIRKVKLESRRGTILDRSGQELAMDLPQFYTLGVRPNQLNNSRKLCQELAGFTNRPTSHYRNRLQTPSKFVYLEWRLTSDQAERLQTLALDGLHLEKSAGRFYPYHRSTAQLLGFTDVDGRGIAGLEVYCDEALKGEKGWEIHQRNARGGSIWDPLRSYARPRDGGTVRLSIDHVAQEVLHHELQRAQANFKAKWAGGILLNPRTGEILAISNVPDFDPLRPEKGSARHHKLRPLTDLFEPGSVFKIVGAAAVLDKKVMTSSDSIYCEQGAYRIGRRTLRDVHKHGWLSFEDVLVNSSNIGMAKVVEKLGSRELYRYALRYGFGSLTGVEFPGEVSAKLRPYDDWQDIDRANIAIGQGIAGNMLHVAMAFAAIANDGILMEPRLVLDITDAKGYHKAFPPREVRRVMEPRTASTLKDILVLCVEHGTGNNAAVEGLRIAGKTGTAQIPNLVEGGYYKDRFIATFVGFLDRDKTDRLLIVTVCEPQGPHFGSQVAAPVFKRVIERLYPADAMRQVRNARSVELAAAGSIMGTPGTSGKTGDFSWLRGPLFSSVSKSPSDEIPDENPSLDVIPDLKGISLREAVRLLSSHGINVKIKGSGWIMRQSPKPGTPMEKCTSCELTAKP
jgi:cell division protein FtsI (penicillin-binding protein 3)